MAKILQFFCMIWGLINIYISKVWTYVGISHQESNDVGDVFKWTMEEVTKLKDILNGEQVLNKKQCVNLVNKLEQVVLYAHKIITKESLNKSGVLLDELHRITRKIRVLVEDCGNQEWCHGAAFQMDNKEAFRELVDDLKCFWDAISERYLALYPDLGVEFNVATCEEIESDEKTLVERLKKRLQAMPYDSEDYEMAKHVWRRLNLELQEVQGAEMSAWEVSKDVIEPVILRKIGCGAGGEVYKSRWLGLESATKMLKVLPNFRKEAGILACLSHPNLIKFICCGRFNKSLEETNDGMKFSRNPYYLVMEVMEMSLSDLLKKQKTPLRYFEAIDIIHEIARGMCYLHDMHVAHLDLKPSNVLVSSMSRIKGGERSVHYDFVKLVDFDTSRMEVQSKPELQEFTIGTTKYMAPEMNNKREKNMACPFQADVWSFAMTCSEILSLKEPFPNMSAEDILLKINDGVRPKLPVYCQDLTTLIEECWVKDHSQRPTFSSICKRLATLKKKFMVGTYSNENPQFGKAKLEHVQLNASPSKKVHERETIKDVVVGLEHNLANVRNHLKHANILGLIGMGGIGKTTLAKAIFDDVRATYDTSCFIENLKSRNSLDILCEILQKLETTKETSSELVDAQKLMRELLATKKVLIILDDPRDATQVDDIIPGDVFNANKGTNIIITTRGQDVIRNRVDASGMIEVEKLDGTAAKKLFTSCAFVGGGELPQLFDLGDKIIEACKGLPLSLKVMGAFLQGKERIRSWERALQRMKRGRCLDGDEEGLWSTLRISFDELKNDEKNMFLDIACFFPMGMMKDRALHTCDNYGTFPNHVLDTLVERSLVQIDRWGYLEMHDQLRDMGRKIAENEDKYSGTRIWRKDMIASALCATHHKELKKVEGIYLNEEMVQWTLDNSMSIDDLDTSSLHMLICPNLSTLPEGLGNLTSLTTFNLSGCSSLTTLPEALGNLTSLTSFHMSKCSRLTSLPYTFGNLTSLTTFNLSCCSRLRTLPEALGNLIFLTMFDLSGCSSLRTLPEALGNLTSLMAFDLSGCLSLTTLPEAFGNLTSLKTFDLSGCSSLTTLPEALGNLTSLTTFNLSECASLRTLPDTFGNLTSLMTFNLSWCSSLTTSLEAFGSLTSLRTFDLLGHSSLKTLPEAVGNLTSLSSFKLWGCSNLTTLPEALGNLISLTTFDLSWCSSLRTLPEALGNLTSLTTFDLSGCSGLTTLPEALGNLTSLSTIKLQGCSNLTTFPEAFGNLTSLKTFNLKDCLSLTTLPEALGNLSSLTTFDLSGCSSLTTLPEGVGNLTSLMTFNLSGCSSLTTLPEALGNLTSLKTFNLKDCLSLTTLPEGVGNLTSLMTFNLSGCSSLTTLPEALGNLTSLKTFNLKDCLSLTTLPEALGNLSSLTTLDLSGCSSLTTLPEGVGNLTSLMTFNLSGCSSLTTLPEALGNLTSLKTFNLKDCLSLTTLPEALGNLSSLTTLDLSGCSSLTTLPEGVGNLTSLMTFNLSGCSSLTTLPEALGNLTSLTTCDLSGCSSLTTLPEGLGNLTSLRTLGGRFTPWTMKSFHGCLSDVIGC